MLQEISLSQAALKLSKAWSVANRLMLSGALGPARQDAAGRWHLSEAGVDLYVAQEQSSQATRASRL